MNGGRLGVDLVRTVCQLGSGGFQCLYACQQIACAAVQCGYALGQGAGGGLQCVGAVCQLACAGGYGGCACVQRIIVLFQGLQTLLQFCSAGV